ncbi:MAG: PDZ domain-containing protein [Cyanobacteria bacterium P01_B01_bin.77]
MAASDDKATLINQMLSQLKTSHTHLYTQDDPAYYQLLVIFYPRVSEFETQLVEQFPEGKLKYTGIGIVTQKKAGNIFIKGIFDGGPVDKAGLKVGDQILSVAGEPFQ